MGCCCGCLRGKSSALSSETEMTAPTASKGKSLSISKAMSAPTIQYESDNKVSGTGLALAGVTIEQDAAYWEWHIEVIDGDESSNTTSSRKVMFGVATKKDRKFYQTTEDGEEDASSQSINGTALMRSIKVSDDDTVGVAVQQSDLPMIQFLVNGEPMHELAINRFRGAVYPSIYFEEGGIAATLVFDESNFREMSPHARFGPLIVARGII